MNQMLRGLRASRFAPQQELARMVGRSRQWLGLVERGRILPQRQEALNLAKLLEVPVEMLFPKLFVE